MKARPLSHARRGVLLVLTACLVWGVAPLYYRYLGRVPAPEMMAHRTIWSFLFFAGLVGLRGEIGQLWHLPRSPEFGRIMAAACLISFNWFAFIWAVQNGRAVEAGLAYYIFPLMAVVLGVATLGERLHKAQRLAVGIAGLGVAALTIGLGQVPWLGLALAASFAAYSRIKRGLVTPALVSVTAEVALIAPLALGWLVWLAVQGRGAFGPDAGATLLLPLAGLITAGPLILFSAGAQRVRLSTLGLVQYLNPTLQVACAVLIMGDAVTPWHGAALVLIWVALAIYSVAGWRDDRRAASADSSSVISPTTVK